jgi:hypothetical protein
VEMRTLTGHKGDVHRLVVLPGFQLLSAAADGYLKVWTLLPESSVEDMAALAADQAAADLDIESMVRALLSDGTETAALDELLDAPQGVFSVPCAPCGRQARQMTETCDVSLRRYTGGVYSCGQRRDHGDGNVWRAARHVPPA